MICDVCSVELPIDSFPKIKKGYTKETRHLAPRLPTCKKCKARIASKKHAKAGSPYPKFLRLDKEKSVATKHQVVGWNGDAELFV